MSRLKTVPPWVAVLGLFGLVMVSALSGFALNAAMHRDDQKYVGRLGAVESWSEKVAKDPKDAPSRLGLANALRGCGQLHAALAEYDDVARDNPRDVAALYGRGDILRELNRHAEAEASLWAVLAQDEGHVGAAEALGEYYAGKRQFRSLVKAVRPAVMAHPTEARLQYLMGLAYEQLGNHDWAAARYRLALDVVPGMPESLEGLKRLESELKGL